MSETWVTGTGPSPSRYMLVGEAPGYWEVQYGEPFVGKTGKELDHFLAGRKIPRSMWYITNAIKYMLPDSGNKNKELYKGLRYCRKWLRKELKGVRPRVIGAMGTAAVAAVLDWRLGDADLETYHGIPLWVDIPEVGHRVKVVPMYHPAAGFHRPDLLVRILADFDTLAAVVDGRIQPREIVEESPDHEYTWVDDRSRESVLDYLGDVVAVDTESVAVGTVEERPWCLSVSSEAHQALVVPVEAERQLADLDGHLKRPGVMTALHNAPYDLPVLRRMGVRPGTWADTMSMAYLLGSEPQGLKPLAYRHLRMALQNYLDVVDQYTREKAMEYLSRVMEYQPWPKPDQVLEMRPDGPHIRQPWDIERQVLRIMEDAVLKGADPYERWRGKKPEEGRKMVEAVLGPMLRGDLSDCDRETAVEYSGGDADATVQLYHIFWPRIVAEGLEETFWRDMGIIPVLVDMTLTGMKVDVEHMEGLDYEFKDRQEAIEGDIWNLTGESFNVGSPQQVAAFLYEKGLLESPEDSTAADVLDSILDADPVVPMLKDWRKFSKLRSTYARKIPRMVDQGRRVHPQWKHTRTETGRLASAEPNLQNQPVRSEEGRRIREGFIAEEGRVLLAADYSQIELRVAAVHWGDETMLDIFRAGGDIHTETAARMFGITAEEVVADEKKYRYPAKTVNFLILYGGGAPTLHSTFLDAGITDWSLEDCEEIIRQWKGTYPGIADGILSTEAEIKRTGRVRDMFGRYRLIPEIYSSDPYTREQAIRRGINAPIQSGAQQVLKEAMGDLVPILEWYWGLEVWWHIVAQVHDELISEVEEAVVDDVAPVVREMMLDDGRRMLGTVPVKVDVEVGVNWKDLAEWQPGMYPVVA